MESGGILLAHAWNLEDTYNVSTCMARGRRQPIMVCLRSSGLLGAHFEKHWIRPLVAQNRMCIDGALTLAQRLPCCKLVQALSFQCSSPSNVGTDIPSMTNSAHGSISTAHHPGSGVQCIISAMSKMLQTLRAERPSPCRPAEVRNS